MIAGRILLKEAAGNIGRRPRRRCNDDEENDETPGL
jgi:hypothetical protein